eukprot:7214211-Pyramimonas_sp.AAC.1
MANAIVGQLGEPRKRRASGLSMMVGPEPQLPDWQGPKSNLAREVAPMPIDARPRLCSAWEAG